MPQTGESDSTVALPSVEPEETLAQWLEGHQKADVTVTLTDGLAADDAVLEVSAARGSPACCFARPAPPPVEVISSPRPCAPQLMETTLAFIKANPAKSAEWKAEADAKMSEQDSA
jgi:hypothetical protein